MQPIENPFTDADRASRGVVRAAAAGPARRLPLRADVREERARALSRRAGQRGRRDPHPCRHGRRADPARRHRLPDRPRDDRARSGASSGSSRRPSCRGSSTRCRRGSRWARGRWSSTPRRSTSIRRPAGPLRSSASSGSSTSEADVRAGAPRAADRDGRRPAAAGPSTVDLHTHTCARTASSPPAELVRAAARPASGSWRSPTTTRWPATASWSPRAAVPAALELDPGRRDQRRGQRRDSRWRKASSTSWASGWTRPTRPSRRRWRSSAPRAGCGSSGRSPGCASWGCRSTPRSRALDLTRDDALGRPTIARALIAAGLATSVEDAFAG